MGILSTFSRFLPWGCFCCFAPFHGRHAEMPKVEEVPPNIHDRKGVSINEIILDSSASDGEKCTVVCISDTHGQHRKLSLPEGDILIHAGDFSPYHGNSNAETLKDFDDWLGSLTQFKHKIVICGNHDLVIEKQFAGKTSMASAITNAKLLYGLETDAFEIRTDSGKTVRVFGAPWIPRRGCCYKGQGFAKWDREREALWRRVPANIDILISHSPPMGVLDMERPGHMGDAALLNVISVVRPAWVVFGHVHETYGVVRWPGADIESWSRRKAGLAGSGVSRDIHLMNACSVDRRGEVRPPIVFEVRPGNSVVPAIDVAVDHV